MRYTLTISGNVFRKNQLVQLACSHFVLFLIIHHFILLSHPALRYQGGHLTQDLVISRPLEEHGILFGFAHDCDNLNFSVFCFFHFHDKKDNTSMYAQAFKTTN
jgi:hypothetical protein